MPLALLTIGINYNGQLQGCLRDSQHVRQYFSARVPLIYNFSMTDDLPSSNSLYPSRQNIERQLLTLKSLPNISHLVVHYSGHGSRSRDRNADESDGWDEVLVPADYRSAGCITDDWLLKNIVLTFPKDRTVLFVIDACHSGTVLDLRYNWLPARRGGYARANNNLTCPESTNVTLLSGCLDKQYSYETVDTTYGISGALTSAFLNVLRTRSSRDPAVLLYYIQQNLSNLQTTVISSTRKTIPAWVYLP